jgi:hypothetical protein
MVQFVFKTNISYDIKIVIADQNSKQNLILLILQSINTKKAHNKMQAFS